MRFRRDRSTADEPEINFIPLIDLLLVILIFLMVSASFSRLAELQVNLPGVGLDAASEPAAPITLAVTRDGRYLIDLERPRTVATAALREELVRLSAARPDAVLVIHADAAATHQSVMNALDAARVAGLARVSFAAQGPVPAR